MSREKSPDIDKALIALATTCKTFHTAFEISEAGLMCKQRALPRLVGPTLGTHGKQDIRFLCLRVPSHKTVRLIKWLESGYISFEDFWRIVQSHLLQGKNVECVKIMFEERCARQRMLETEKIARLKLLMAHQKSIETVPVYAFYVSCDLYRLVPLTRATLLEYYLD